MKARRALAVSVATVLALGLMIPTVLAGVTSATDSFATPSYSGGSGWTTDWTEAGDGSGTASGGVIRAVSSGCLDTSCVRFESLLGVSETYGIWRRTNIDGAIGATLSFSYKTNGLGTLSVAARSGPSEAWTEQTLPGSGSYTTHSISIAAHASNTTEVQFSLSSLIVAASAHIDNVSVAASYPTTTSTTSTTIASTTTPTSEPILTVPTVTIPTVTIPPVLTTTTSTTSTTTIPGSTTSTTTGSTSTTTDDPAAPGPGGPEANPPNGTGPGFDLPPLSEAEADLASDNNIAVDIATGEDFMTFGVNPLTNLGVKLNSTVEVITTEILSALALGAMLAFFGIRRVEDNEEVRS